MRLSITRRALLAATALLSIGFAPAFAQDTVTLTYLVSREEVWNAPVDVGFLAI